MDQAQVNTHFDDRDARYKTGKSLVTMRLVNERVDGLVVGENTRIGKGECEVQVWSTEVASVLAMVEKDTGAIAEAARSFEVELARFAQDFLKEGPLKTMSPDDLVSLHKEGKTPELEKAWEQATKLTGLSIEGQFHRARGRDIKPLSKAEVVEKDQPSPYMLSEIAHSKMVASLLAQSGAQSTAKK